MRPLGGTDGRRKVPFSSELLTGPPCLPSVIVWLSPLIALSLLAPPPQSLLCLLVLPLSSLTSLCLTSPRLLLISTHLIAACTAYQRKRERDRGKYTHPGLAACLSISLGQSSVLHLLSFIEAREDSSNSLVITPFNPNTYI